MKKIFTMILAIAMLLTAVAAVAEGRQGGPMGGPPQGQMQGGSMGPRQGGERPSDAPEGPEGMTGERPEMPTDGQAPTDGQQPPQRPADDRMIDFDALVTEGIISQETRDKIKAYMEEHKPEGEVPQGVPGEGQAPVDGQTPPEKPTGEKPADAPEEPADGQGPDLLSDLLSAGIITQAEYEAIHASING